MPQSLLGAPGVIWVGGSAVIKAFAIKAAIAVALAAGTNAYAKDQAKKNNNQPEREALNRSAVQPKSVCFGYCVKSGSLAYMNAVQTEHSGGVSSHELHMAIVVAGHPVSEIKDLYLDGHCYNGGGEINWTTNTIVGGPLSLAITPADCEAVKVWRHHGDQTAPDAELEANYNDITSAHVGHGLSYIVLRFAYNRGTLTLFENGQPQTIRAGFDAAKVYDPRLDSTVSGGSGAHRVDDPSTWEFSKNSILCAAYYMVAWMHVAPERINWPVVMEGADICDELVDIPGPTTEERYTCNGSVSLGDPHGDNLQAILDTCMGRAAFVSGLWELRAGAYPTPSGSLTDADILTGDGTVTLSSSFPREDRYNTVRAVYCGEEFGYHDADALEQSSDDFIDRDNGEVLVKQLHLPLVTGEFQAQRIEYKTLQQSDMQKIITLPLWWSAMNLVVGSVPDVSFSPLGWSAKTVRCVNFKQGGPGVPIEGTFREESEGSWADPVIAEYSIRTTAGVIIPGVVSIHPPGDLTVRATKGGNNLTWTQPSDHAQSDYYRLYASESNAAGAAVVVYEGRNTFYFHETITERWYWIVAVRGNEESDTYPSGSTSTVTAAPKSNAAEVALANPGFEYGFEGWTITGGAANHFSIATDPANAHNGDRMLRIGGGTGIFGAHIENDTLIPVGPGNAVSWGCYYKTDASFGGVFSINLIFLDGNKNPVAVDYGPGDKLSVSTTHTTWTRLGHDSQIAPAGAVWCKFTIDQKFNSTTTYGYVDDVWVAPFSPILLLSKLPYEDSFDEFELARYLNLDYEILTGTAQTAIIDSTGGVEPVMGGPFVLRLGDNSGNDQLYVAQRRNRTTLLPVIVGGGAGVFAITFHVRQKSGAGSMYLGIRCVDATRAADLLEGTSDNHYIAANGLTIGDTAWHTYTGYFTTDGTTSPDSNVAGVGNWTLANPMKINPNTRWVGPLYVVNFNSQAGEVEIAYTSIRHVGGKGDIAVDNYPPLESTRKKAGDTSRNTTTTLADDASLIGWLVEPNTQYRLSGSIVITSGAAPAYKFALQFSNNPIDLVAHISGVDCNNAPIASVVTDLHTTAFVVNGGSGTGFVQIDCVFDSHATLRANLDYQWAQNTSDGSATITKKNSRLTLTKVPS